ncbi:DUF1330 domain-containing protein [Endozoicomonadaceae bacterium StTr2]
MDYPVFLMIEATPDFDNLEAMVSYMEQAHIVSKAHGVVKVATYDVERALDDASAPSVFSVLSFPHRQAVEALFSDPEYQKLLPLRDQGFRDIRYYICSEKI